MHDAVDEIRALVADVHAGARDDLLDVAHRLPAEGTGEAGRVIRVLIGRARQQTRTQRPLVHALQKEARFRPIHERQRLIRHSLLVRDLADDLDARRERRQRLAEAVELDLEDHETLVSPIEDVELEAADVVAPLLDRVRAHAEDRHGGVELANLDLSLVARAVHPTLLEGQDVPIPTVDDPQPDGRGLPGEVHLLDDRETIAGRGCSEAAEKTAFNLEALGHALS